MKKMNQRELNKFDKEIVMLQRENEERKHQYKMEELKYIRETEEIRHDLELQRLRIKSAEIKRTMDRKSWKEFGEAYSGGTK